MTGATVDDVLADRARYVVLHGDCLEVLRALPDACLDSCVTDPPYALGFMGKKWDSFAPENVEARVNGKVRKTENAPPGSGNISSPAFIEYDLSPTGLRAFQRWCTEWAGEVLRVLKPGGYLVAFGGQRTYHRLACGIEDAGFEIRDSLNWLFGSGFPKSLNVSRAIDEADGVTDQREVVHRYTASGNAGTSTAEKGGTYGVGVPNSDPIELSVTRGATERSRAWDGFGTALKPGHEPVVLARKPFKQPVAANVLEHGTGALNIDACRVATDWNEPDRPESWKRSGHSDKPDAEKIAAPAGNGIECHPGGRWPPNVLLTHSAECVREGVREGVREVRGNHAGNGGLFGMGSGFKRPSTIEPIAVYRCVEGCPVRELDEQSGELTSGALTGQVCGQTGGANGKYGSRAGVARFKPADTGTASRFFPQLNWDPQLDDITPFLYAAKAARSEREEGCSKLPARTGAEATGSKEGQKRLDSPRSGAGRSASTVRNHHPTVKPIEVMRWLVRLVTRKNGVVLDLFLGSGTTGVACWREDMRFIGIEREAEYVAIAKARIDYWARQGNQLSLLEAAL